MKRKRVTILWHNGGRLANQLWFFISVYAYCLEKNYKISNPSFFEYVKHFENIKIESKLVKLFYVYPLVYLQKKLSRINILRLYKIYVKIITLLNKKDIIYAPMEVDDLIYYLEPTETNVPAIKEFEKNNKNEVFLNGWLFRNPVGIRKYRKEIREYFKPANDLSIKIDEFMSPLKKKYEHVVGVHIRQGDYKKEFHGGKLYFNEEEVDYILKQYLKHSNKDKEKTCFVICSDGFVDLDKFTGLNVKRSELGPIEDLYILARSNVIVGADSTFGGFASYYGDVPFIVFKRDGIDWDFYKDKKHYFENKHSLFYEHIK